MEIQRKNIFLITCIVFQLITFSTYSQNRWSLGLSIAIQNTKLQSETMSRVNVESAYRPFFDAIVQYRFTKKLALESGIGYSLLTQNTSEFNNNFNYLSMPFYLKLGSYKKDRKIALSYLIGIKTQYLFTAKNIYNNNKTDITEYCDKLHFEGLLGLGVKYKLNDIFEIEFYGFAARGTVINETTHEGFNLYNKNMGLMFNLLYLLN